ncbi:MAG TPA: hypothetical protein VFT45_24765 [Longimicrobium sp.]|nr:hypothetical protein [Longimicrobium sp.]
MSAAALRRPARWPRVAWAESAAIWHPASILTPLVIFLLVAGGSWDQPLTEVRDLALLMFFFPLLHWRGRPAPGSLDQAVPVGSAPYALVRVACGAAAALLTLVLATLLNLSTVRAGGYPASYPAALILAGVGSYLLGSAAVLGGERPGRVVVVLLLPALLVADAAGVELWSWGRTVPPLPGDTAGPAPFRPSLTLAAGVLWLAAGCVAVCASAWLGGRSRRLARARAARLSADRTAPVPAAALAVPRRPVTLGVVAARQLALQAPGMGVMLLMAVLAAALSAWRGPRGGLLAGGGPLMALAMVAFFAPVLVWLDEDRRRGDWDGARAVDPFRRVLLQALGGLLWLQAAVLVVLAGCIAGALRTGEIGTLAQVPGWVLPGVPLAVAGLYSLGTFWRMISGHPVEAALIGWLVTVEVLFMLDGMNEWGAIGRVLAPSHAFAAVRYMAPVQAWSPAAAAIWIPLCAALAVFSIRRRVRRDLHRTGPASAPHVARPAPLRLGEVL